MGGQRNTDGKAWLLIKHRDEYVSTRDILEEDRSGDQRPDDQGPAGRPHAARRRRRRAVRIRTRPRRRSRTRRRCGRCCRRSSLSRSRARAGSSNRSSTACGRWRSSATARCELRSRRGNVVTVQYPEAVEGAKRQRVQIGRVRRRDLRARRATARPDFQILQGRINLSRPAEVERAAAETPADLLRVRPPLSRRVRPDACAVHRPQGAAPPDADRRCAGSLRRARRRRWRGALRIRGVAGLRGLRRQARVEHVPEPGCAASRG